jgi:pyrroline-5-carboxylate reductase
MKSTENKAVRGPRDFHSRVRKLALIGCGKMGEALLSGILGSQLIPVEDVEVTVAEPPQADFLAGKYGVRASTNNIQAVKGADLVLIVLKPQQVKGVLHEIKTALRKDAVIISVAASVTTALIERELGRPARVIRAMPNTPCLIRQGMTALAANAHAAPDDVSLAREIFGAMGRTVVVEEKHMDAITGLSASGPAYVYLIIESLAEGGVKLGLPRELSTELSAQTLLGAASLVYRWTAGIGRGRPARHLDQSRGPRRATRQTTGGRAELLICDWRFLIGDLGFARRGRRRWIVARRSRMQSA